MKRSRFMEEQIIETLKEHQADSSAAIRAGSTAAWTARRHAD